MYKLSFTLKQHTPIIHFQHEQDGATLRATEVKPKLDRFIIAKMGGDKKLREIFPRWFVGEHPSLDYKMRIDADNSLTTIPINYTETNDGKFRPDFPCLFGNVDTEEKKKVFQVSDNLNVRIITSNQELLNKIEETVNEFFFSTNFGFRQSKGFGSFLIKNGITKFDKAFHFVIDISKIDNQYKKFEKIFSDINLLYKTLRSGINTSNFNGIYFKSLMFMFAKSDQLEEQWDKKTIRETLYSDHELFKRVNASRTESGGTVQFNAKNKNNLLFRDLLGLSSDQDWMGYGKLKTDNQGNPILKNGNKQYRSDVVSKESSNGKIERFKSPILFKPVKRDNEERYDVYIMASDIPNEVLGSKFQIRSKSYPAKNFEMNFPKRFDPYEYLKYCFQTVFSDKYTVENHIQGNKNSIEAKRLVEIFKELSNC